MASGSGGVTHEEGLQGLLLLLLLLTLRVNQADQEGVLGFTDQGKHAILQGCGEQESGSTTGGNGG